jgi:hypothetical protein
MHFEGRIETTFQGFLPIVGLDTAEKHCLLDQRCIPESNCQVAGYSVYT